MLMLKSLMMLILAMTIKQQLQPEEPLMSGGIQWNRSFFYVVVGLVDANHGKLAMMFQPNGPPKSCWCCCFWSCWWSQPWIWSTMIFQPNGPSASGCREGGGGPRPLQQVFQRPLWGPSPSCSSWWWRGGCRWWTMMAMTMIVTRVMYTNSSILIYLLCFYLISSLWYLVHFFLIHCKSFINSLIPEYWSLSDDKSWYILSSSYKDWTSQIVAFEVFDQKFKLCARSQLFPAH